VFDGFRFDAILPAQEALDRGFSIELKESLNPFKRLRVWELPVFPPILNVSSTKTL
jgi:hypothetical protein